MLKIGNLKLKYHTIPAPMAILTEIAFRKLLDDIGFIGYMVSEMISAEGLIRRNPRTFEMMQLSDFKTPQFIQIFSENINSIRESVKIIANETGFDGIDFNMGCPASKVVKKGAGSSLLQDLDKIKAIVSVLKETTDLPITIKVRLGFGVINIFDTIKTIIDAGADAIAVHFRLRSTPYTIPAQWEYASKLKEQYNFVFIGNGDIDNFQTGLKRLNLVDGIMIGRSAISNPLIFEEIAKNKKSDINRDELFLKLIQLIEHYYKAELQLPKLKPFIR